MKKQILAFVLVFALLFSMTISASAASASKRGQTSGGILTNLPTSATLNVYTEHATAGTWCELSSCTISTIAYLHLNDGRTLTGYGTVSATAVKSTEIDIPNTKNGSSEHNVNGGSQYGVWTASLSANVW